jgi:hypothetical protein
MLLIGDIVINELDPKHKVKILEIIYSSKSELDYIISKFNLSKGYDVNKYTKEYAKSDITFRLHNAEKHKGLSLIISFCTAKGYTFKFPPLLIEYALRQLRMSFLHNDIEIWLTNTKALLLLRKELMLTVNTVESAKSDIDTIEKLFTDFILVSKEVRFSKYIPHDFNIYSKKNLLSTVSKYKVPLYEIANEFKEGLKLDLDEFESLEFNDRIDLCVERLKMDVLNNYICRSTNYMKSCDKKILFKLYKISIMNIVNSNSLTNGFFKLFVLLNNEMILDRFSPHFYDTFKKKINDNTIKIIN